MTSGDSEDRLPMASHGFLSRGMTFGCIALEDSKIDELFSLVLVGTSVTIVGAMDFDNSIVLTVKELT